MTKYIKSIEPKIVKWAELQLNTVQYYDENDTINPEIENALKIAPSKLGKNGPNRPDIKLFLEISNLRKIPVMIEAKGRKGDFIKINASGEIDNKKKDGSENFANINKYAVNGAIHYATAIVEHTESYKEAIAIGINGFDDYDNERVYEIGVYYISSDNFCIPKKIGNYSDLSFLLNENQNAFVEEIDKTGLTEAENEAKTKEFENEIETKLKNLNQIMEDKLNIYVGFRVKLITGMIMAGLGVENAVSPLEVSELKGEKSSKANDGRVILNKIEAFLEERNLPKEKKEMVITDLSQVFVYSDLWKPIRGESKLKTVYTSVKNDIMPVFTSARHLDFTGRLFNVLNTWVKIPDGNKNDVVLTPRYVTELMVKLTQVNKDSYVWDYAVGSAGFLISAMKLMIKDAESRVHSPKELQEKLWSIKNKQLLGIEKRPDIYLLAVLNMILMGDGSTNIIHKDSLTEYEGKYEQGELNGQDFPADVFLLNPPYSAPGKGFVFVKKAFAKMNEMNKKGKAAVLIQENAGSKYGLPYTKDILENNTLIASIHMADIFKGRATVQTAIYVFDVGTPHSKNSIVKFIDFSNDGYQRLNKKKAGPNVNLKDTNNAAERYEEIVNLVLFGKSYLKIFTEEEYIEDTISLKGDDWTFFQHKQSNITPTEDDFRNTVKDFLIWELSTRIKGKLDSNLKLSALHNYKINREDKTCIKEFRSKNTVFVPYKVGELFDIHPTKSYNCTNPKLYSEYGNYEVVSNSSENNGRTGFSSFLPTEKDICTFSDTTSGMSTLFYQEGPFIGYSHVQGLYPYSDKWNKYSCLFLVTALKKCDNGFDYATKMNRELVSDFNVLLPIIESATSKTEFTIDDIDFSFMERFIKAIEKEIIGSLFD